MNEQRSNFIPVVEHETIPPSDNRTSQRTQRETITSDEQCRTVRHAPDVDEIEDIGVIAEVEEEVVPGAFLVVPGTDREQNSCSKGICYVDISGMLVSTGTKGHA